MSLENETPEEAQKRNKWLLEQQEKDRREEKYRQIAIDRVLLEMPESLEICAYLHWKIKLSAACDSHANAEFHRIELDEYLSRVAENRVKKAAAKPEPEKQPLSKLRWHYGPTSTDPQPGHQHCYDCGGSVLCLEGIFHCCGCGRESED